MSRKLIEIAMGDGTSRLGLMDGDAVTLDSYAVICATAQGILDARALYPGKSLAWLYDEATMPPELRQAHALNDRAVREAYGLPPEATEAEVVAELMKLYSQLTGEGTRQRKAEKGGTP